MNDKRHFQNEAWGTIKFFTTIYTAILSITTILVTNLYETNQTTNVYNSAFIIFLPISAIFISIIGWYNFRRVNARAFEIVASLMKVEKLLGFHDKINEGDRFFIGDEYALPKKYVDIDRQKLENTEVFVDWMLKREAKFGKFYSIFSYLFLFYIFITIILIILILLVIR